MKKSFYLLMCILLVACAFVSCDSQGADTHKHTYAPVWSSNETMHWYAATCEHTSEKANVALHVDQNNDGTCDICSYGSDHEHTYAETWSYDADNHWYAPSCGHTVELKDSAAHLDENNDKLCDVCKYDYNHTHTYSSGWSGDADNHWHDASCGCTILPSETEAHIDRDRDGVCEVCLGNTYPDSHVHTYSATWKYDVTSHWQVSDCHPGITSAPTAHKDGNNDGLCDSCLFDYLHEHTYASAWSGDATHHWHAPSCGHSVAAYGKEEHADNDNDGLCDVCSMPNYDTATHSHEWANEYTSNAAGHWRKAICEHTGATTTPESHTGIAGDGICDTCGWFDDTHEHSYSPDYSYDEQKHWQISTCGHSDLTLNGGAHIDEDGDMACDVCEYDYNHTHSYSSVWSHDDKTHWIDTTCGCSIKSSESAHTDSNKDGVCDFCDANTFTEDHEHQFGLIYSYDLEYHWYPVTCLHEGILNPSIQPHSDENDDGLCDICTNPTYPADHVHEFDVEYSSSIEGHWYICECHTGLIVEIEPHTDENSDGECDICEMATDPAHQHEMELESVDATSHKYRCKEHHGYFTVTDHSGIEGDGICDVCAWFDETHTHTYESAYLYDISAHWYAASCGHHETVERLAHKDEDNDGRCDDCGAETLDSIIKDITSTNAKKVVISGILSDAYGNNIYYDYGTSYCHIIEFNMGWEYWYGYVGDKFYAIKDYGYGDGYVAVEDAISAMMQGWNITIADGAASAYGIENTVLAMWNQALESGFYTLSSADNVYSFTYCVNHENREINEITVQFEVSIYGENRRYISAANITARTFSYDSVKITTEGELTHYDVSGLSTIATSTLEVEKQRAGKKTYSYPIEIDKLIASSYDFADENGDIIADGSTVEVPFTGELKLYLTNLTPGSASFNIDTLTVTVEEVNNQPGVNVNCDYIADGYITISAPLYGVVSGTYTVTIKSSKVTHTFEAAVNKPVLESFAIGTYNSAESRYTESTAAEAIVNTDFKFVALVNEGVNASAQFEISPAEGASIYKTENSYYGWVYTFRATKAGTYTVKLTSNENSDFTAELTVTVTAAPTVSEILCGSYSVDATDYYGEHLISVVFTPSAADAVNGTALITITTHNGTNTYNVKYAYDKENGIVLTTAEGDPFSLASFAINENYELTAEFESVSYNYNTGDYEPSLVGATLVYDGKEAALATTFVNDSLKELANLDDRMYWEIILSADGSGRFILHQFSTANLSYSAIITANFNWKLISKGEDECTIVIYNVADNEQFSGGILTVNMVKKNSGNYKASLTVSLTVDGVEESYDFTVNNIKKEQFDI